jgi:hypothetical protein
MLKKLKPFLIICMFIVTGKVYSQEDSLVRSKVMTITRAFSENGEVVTSYGKLPQFIRHYLYQKRGERFRIAKKRFNGTDIGAGPRRRLAFITKLNDDYILSYEHGGRGYHCHSIIFETNGKEVIGFYNLAFFDKQNNVKEFMEMLKDPRTFMVKTYNEL